MGNNIVASAYQTAPEWRLVCGLGPYHNEDQTIVAFEMLAYSDESGSEPDQKFCLIAGFASRPDIWQSLEAEWAKVLKDHDVPEFKSTRYFARDSLGNRVGEYAGWSDERATEYRDRLLGIISTHVLLPVGAAVEHRAFGALTIGERRFLTGGRLRKDKPHKWKRTGAPSKPYMFAMLAAVGSVVQELRDYGSVRVNFFFDENTVIRDNAIKTYHDLKDNLKEEPDPIVAAGASRMGFIGFDDSELQPRLQVADLLANAWHGELVGDKNEERALMFRAVEKRSRLEVFDNKRLDHMLSMLGEQRAYYQRT
jgi:hypothetical protein